MKADENIKAAPDEGEELQAAANEMPAEVRSRTQDNEEFERQIAVGRRIMREHRAVLEALAK